MNDLSAELFAVNSRVEDDTVHRRQWWDSLEPQWQKAFRESSQYGDDPDSADDQFKSILKTEVLRLAGPHAAYPDLSFELTNLSGLRRLFHLKILVLIDHQICDLTGLSQLTALTSLFVYNNALQSLHGIETLAMLETLYVQNNQISSLEPLEKLFKLREVNVSSNELTSLEGLAEHHADTFRNFVCLPNEKLPQREIIRVENHLGIRCK